MKGGKDEEKVTGPLFPRLHVNDTEKGGPRAPPRNKMALYEQLSIPSQRFNSSASTLPLPPHNASSVVPSTPSGQGDGHERNFFSPFYMPSHTPAHLTEKIHSHSSDGMNSNTTTKLERRSVKNPSKNKRITSNGECSSFRPHYFSGSKSSCGQKLGEEEDDFRVPTYVHTDTVLSPNKDQTGGDTELPTPFHKKPGQLAVIPTSTPQKNGTATYNSPFKLQNIHDKALNQTNAASIKSQLHAQYQSEPRRNDTAIIKGITERSTAQPHCREQTVVQEHPSTSVNVLDTSHDGNKDVSQEINAKLLSKNDIHHSGICGEARCSTGNGTAKAENGTRVRSESCSRASSGNGNRSPNQAENCSNETEGKACWPAQVEDADETDDVSETSMVDSVSGLDISPDDVVGIIGQKRFWKARKAIVNQQRVFAVQVFELHRLIKVQKLIAGSPHLLLEEYPYLGRPPPKVAAKKPPSVDSLKSQPSMTKPKNDSPKPSQNIECPAESTVSKPSQPSLDNTVNKGLVSQVPTCGPYSGNPLPVPVAADSRSNPWCFHPPGNQWLVPVVSPSEGLVYKPYMGPCPPAGSFMAPIYGGCGPIPMPVPAYGFPASHQQPGIGVIPGAPAVAPNYFPSPCGLPMMNPVISTSAVEQANLSGGPRPHGQLEQVSTADVNFNMHSRISCNMSNQKSEAFSCHVGKLQASKDSELQGSTGSSPCERANRRTPQITEGQDVLPLFPMALAIEDPNKTSQAHSSDQQARVIKVVPHNPRSATESAARIFQSIQEERQQHDSL